MDGPLHIATFARRRKEFDDLDDLKGLMVAIRRLPLTISSENSHAAEVTQLNECKISWPGLLACVAFLIGTHERSPFRINLVSKVRLGLSLFATMRPTLRVEATLVKRAVLLNISRPRVVVVVTPLSLLTFHANAVRKDELQKFILFSRLFKFSRGWSLRESGSRIPHGSCASGGPRN